MNFISLHRSALNTHTHHHHPFSLWNKRYKLTIMTFDMALSQALLFPRVTFPIGHSTRQCWVRTHNMQQCYVGYPPLLWGNNNPKQEMACIKVVNYNKNNNKSNKKNKKILGKISPLMEVQFGFSNQNQLIIIAYFKTKLLIILTSSSLSAKRKRDPGLEKSSR